MEYIEPVGSIEPIEFSIVVAGYEINKNIYGIGSKGKMPWNIIDELAHFRKITLNHIVIMGRKTWESLPIKHRPLAGRLNIIITNHELLDRDNPLIITAKSLNEGLHIANQKNKKYLYGGKIFVIGGGLIYHIALRNEGLNEIHLSKIHTPNKGTVFDTFINLDDNIKNMKLMGREDYNEWSYFYYKK